MSEEKAVKEVENQQDPVEKGSVGNFGAMISMINTMIGAGLISIPYGFSNVGIVPGLALGVAIMLISIFSLHLVSVVAQAIGGRKTSFYAACEKFFPNGKYVVDLLIVAQGFGSATAYLILIKKLMITIMAGSGAPELFLQGKIWIVLIVCFVTFPLSLLRSLSSLRFSSYLAVLVVLYLTSLVVAYGCLRISNHPGGSFSNDIEIIQVPNSFNGVIKCMSYLVFAFTCQQNMFKIYNDLTEPRNSKRMTVVSIIATLLVGTVYMIFGTMGYLALGSMTSDDLLSAYSNVAHEFGFGKILKLFDSNGTSLLIAQISVVLLVTTCFPIQIHPTRDSMIQFVTLMNSKFGRSSEKKRIPFMQKIVDLNERTDNGVLHYLVATILCFLALSIALVVDDLGKVFGLVGGIASNAIGFLLPALFYILYDRRPFSISPKRCLAALQFLIGILLLVAALYSTFV